MSHIMYICTTKKSRKILTYCLQLLSCSFQQCILLYLYECIDIDRLKDLIDSLINLIFEISTETDKDIEQLISVID